MEIFNQSAEKNEEESLLQNIKELDIIKPVFKTENNLMEIKTIEKDKKDQQMLDKGNLLQIINVYREDMFKKMDEIDSNCDGTYAVYKKYIENKIDSFEKLINVQNFKINEIIQTNISNRLKIEKVNDLLIFKSDTDYILYDVNRKISGIEIDMKSYKKKYEEILLENLYVPGIIGSGKCKFRNLKEYVEVCY